MSSPPIRSSVTTLNASHIILYAVTFFLQFVLSDAQKIYAAGRGLMAESLESAAEVIVLSGKSHPNLLYLGTSSYDNPQKARSATKNYAALGCSISTLNVSWTTPSESDVQAAFEAADIILIEGGNTLFAVDRWAKLGMDDIIRSKVIENDVVVAGGSAGFISLCNGGHSDSMKPESFKNPVGPLLNPSKRARDGVDRVWEYIRVPGLGIIDAICCPHYDTTQNNGVSRADDFTGMMKRHLGEYAIAMDEWAALVIDGHEYHVVSRSNHTGSVGPGGTFVMNSSGLPGIWTISVDGNTGDLARTLVPAEGQVSDIIHPPRFVVDDPFVMAARKQNPDDGRPPAWTYLQSDNAQAYLYVTIVVVFIIAGAIFFVKRKRRTDSSHRFEQVGSKEEEA